MKKLTYLFLFIGIVFTISCQDDVPCGNLPNIQTVNNKYSISEESALAYLADFFDETEPDSRGGKKISVKSIKPIKYNRVASRAMQDTIDCENLLYIANFEDNQGYAVLAGDERIPDKIIALADTGNMNGDELERNNWIIFEGYPLTGPGFYTTPETGDELFMNPNTVNLYIDSISDTLVGNFINDNIDAVDEFGNPITTSSDSLEWIERLSTTLCVNYALNGIDSEIRDNTLILGDEGGILPPPTTKVETSPWTITSRVSPMLTNYAYWHQHAPFNDLYPTKRKYGFFGPRRRTYAGCFPLAISKLLTYFKTPNEFYHNGYLVSWNALNLNFNWLEGKKSAAHLLKGISNICDCWHFYGGTFTFPGKAAHAMRLLGLNNSDTYRYSWERVTTMLDKGCPIITYAMPGIDITSSHAWNIDGYKIKERTITYRTYIGETLKEERTEKEILNMVHCDFGWGGTSNGYYVSGVFKSKDTRVEQDSDYFGEKEFKYNSYIHIIMYDKP